MVKKMFYSSKSSKSNDKFLLKIGEVYFNLALVEKAYNVIKDTKKELNICYSNTRRMLYLKNNLGMVMVCGMHVSTLPDSEKVIEIKTE